MATVVPLLTQDPADAGPDAREQSKPNAAIETSPDTLDAVLITELRESQRMLATLLSNLHGMAYRCKNDPEWTMEYISEGCLELTGYTPSDLINSPSIAYGHLIDPADRTAVWEAVQIGLGTHEPFQITYRLHTAAGAQRWVHERGRGVYGTDGELLALEGYITDVTDLQRSQDALHRAHQDLERRVMARTAELELANQRLREQEARFHALADHAGDAIFVVDRDGIIVYANERAAALTGLDATRLLRQPFASIAPPDVQPVLAGRLHQCLTRGPVPNPFETSLLHGATSIPVELNEVRSRWMDVEVDIIIARDISERNRAVLALQRERQFTDTILDTVAMWVVVIDVSGNIIHLNRACEVATGLSLEEIRGKCFWNFFVPAELRARVSASFATRPVEPMPRTYESTFTTDDGKERHIAWQIGAAYGDDGSAAYYIGAGMDITERQELEELRIKEHVINASLVPIGISDLSGHILYANPALVRLWGYDSATEVLGLDHALLFQFPDQVRSTFAHVQETGSWVGEASCISRSGIPFTAHAAASLVTNTAGEPLLITSSFIDLTEIHRAQSALAVSERRYRRIVETAQEGVWMIDADSRTTFANDKMGEILGYQPEEMLGKQLNEFMDEDGRLIAEQNLERRRRGISEQHEFKFQRKDGSFVWALLGTNPILDDAGSYCGALAMVTDITERKRTEAALAHYATELEQSNQDLEQFAYVASHDLQEPLRMVASYVQLLARQYQGKLDAEADQYIDYVVDGAKRMQRLIQDLLALSRISTRPQIMRNIDCEMVLAEVLKNLQIVIEDSGASLTHTPLPVVSADRGQLVQLFQNLIGNALKFHGDSPPQVHIAAELQPGDGAVEPPYWLFRISDNGIGIDPQYFDRIFEIFQRLHGRDEYSGTGIGLAICRRIVERHGGRIGVISTPGHGATFYFTLPVNVTNALNECDSDRRG